MTVGEPTVVVIGAGYDGKRRYYERLGVPTFLDSHAGKAAQGLPGNPPEAVDPERRKVRTREMSTWLGLPTAQGSARPSLDTLFAAAADVGRQCTQSGPDPSPTALPIIQICARRKVMP